MTPFEWRVVAAADGGRDLQAIATTLGEPEFDVARAAFGLSVAGVILLRDPVQESAAAPREDAAALFADGDRLLRSRNFDAALGLAETAVGRYPEDARAHLLLGRVHLAERRFGPAEAALREAVRLDPASPRALRLLSWALLGIGRLDEAVHGFEGWLAMPDLGTDEEKRVTSIGAAIPAARQLATLLRAQHD